MWVPLLTTGSCWGCGQSCFRGAHAAPYNHLMHPLVGRQPSRSPAVPQTGGCCTGSGQRCDASRVTTVSARLGFHCCSLGLSPLPYKFCCFLCTSFQTDAFFVSKFSLSFPGYHLLQLMVGVLFNMISWGLMVVSPCSKISLGYMLPQTVLGFPFTHGVYTDFSILAAVVRVILPRVSCAGTPTSDVIQPSRLY